MSAAFVNWRLTIQLTPRLLDPTKEHAFERRPLEPGQLGVAFERPGAGVVARRIFVAQDDVTLDALQAFCARPVKLSAVIQWVGDRIEGVLFATDPDGNRLWIGEVLRYPQEIIHPELPPDGRLIANGQDLLRVIVAGKADDFGRRLLHLEGIE